MPHPEKWLIFSLILFLLHQRQGTYNLLWPHFQISNEIRWEAYFRFWFPVTFVSFQNSCHFGLLNGLLISISCLVPCLLLVLQDCQSLFTNLAYLLLQNSSAWFFLLLYILLTSPLPHRPRLQLRSTCEIGSYAPQYIH